MPVVISAKVSADAGNSIVTGSDGGLFAAQPGGDAAPAYFLDNSWADTGSSFYYSLGPTYATSTMTYPIGTAVLEPLMVARAAKAVSLSVNILTGGTGASLLYYALYGVNPATGWPVSKVYDWGSVAANAQGVVPLTIPAAAQALSARTMYWLASWATGTAGPQVTGKNNQGLFPIRQPAMPTTTTAGTYGLLDTSIAWGSATVAPATVNPTLTTATATPATQPPLFWIQLTNGTGGA